MAAARPQTMIAGYRDGRSFAYPGWRLTVPGGPAGGHYKGFTHTQAAGTDIPPGDLYEQDREDGMSSHDSVHASQRNPRGVYRSAAEVPPRANASGSAHTYRGFQTRHHPGQSVAPGSFPADFIETNEDDFLPHAHLGAVNEMVYARGPIYSGPPILTSRGDPIFEGGPILRTPNTVPCASAGANPPPGMQYVYAGSDINGCPIYNLSAIPTTGATSTVTQPPATPLPLPPAPSIPVVAVPPVSPTPGPIVATNEVIPLNDGSGNYLNLSTGTVIPASAVSQNPATGQLVAAPGAAAAGFSMAGALTWLEQPSTWFPSIPNWGLLAGAAAAAMFFMGKKHGK